MKTYYPYDVVNPKPIYGEEHVIKDGQILLNHIPYLNSIEISGFKQTQSVNILPGQFYCAYGSEYLYREANCIVKFNQQHDGETVSVDYLQVGTIITANDMNEVKAHLENAAIHNHYELPAATAAIRGGVRVGAGLSILGDILSADAQDFTLTPATHDSLGGVKVGHGLSIDASGLLTADAQDFTLTPATHDSLGGIKVGDGLSITGDGLLSAYALQTATTSRLGGVKVGSRLSITGDGLLSADSLQTATPARLGGVVIESDTNIAATIERYFPSVTADTEIIPVLTSIPPATADSLGGVKIGDGLSIDASGLLTADAQDFTLTPATHDSLGGVKVGHGLSITGDGLLTADAQDFTLTPATHDSLGGIKVGNTLTMINGTLNYNLPSAGPATKGGVVCAADSDIAATIERYFPSVTADTEIIPVLTSIPPATHDSLGGVKVGEGLSITEDGLLTADALNFTLTPATTSKIGGVKVGEGLSITNDGILSAAAQGFTLTPATADSMGGVIAGVTMSIEDGVIDYYLPAASASQLGGVKVGNSLTMTDGTLNYSLPAASDEEISAIIGNYFPE